MFWLDRIYGQIEKAIPEKLASGKTLVVRDEKTASGRVHVGSMRALALHTAIAERLEEAEVPHVFKYEINDMDPMDGLPVYLDASVYKKEMGKPLFAIPSPDGKAKNFAEYFAEDYIAAIREAGFSPEFYRASELYFSGKMDPAIRTALDKVRIVKKIYEEMYGNPRPDDWYPLSVICENCGKMGTTKVYAWDGEQVSYRCAPHAVEWAEGCGHEGKVSPFGGKAKFLWKLDWPAKWFVVGVDIEGAGKDHYSKGGSRDVARRISQEVFEYPEPFGVPNEFFLIGGKKMSSSKGEGSSAKDVVELIPPKIFRLAMFGKDISQQINFDPAGDTIPVLWDTYDKLAAKFWSGIEDDDARLFTYLHPETERPKLKEEERFLPRFSQVAFLVQMPHLDLQGETEKMKGKPLTALDRAELDERARFAKVWLERAASDDFKFTLQDGPVPEAAKHLSAEQKDALKKVLGYVDQHATLDGAELHTALHEIRKESGLSAGEFFGALYLSFLGKPSGPKAGWFISVLDREFVLARLTEVSA
jgi:lysyl-tRNA synthetase class 1